MSVNQDELRAEVERLVAEYRMPGVVVACWRDGVLSTAAAGMANLNTGAPMTVDTGFLTGSITKVWATTLIMGLVEEGVVDLDAPIVRYVPEVQFGADEEVATSLVVRNLLNHSSGVDTGDLFVSSRGYPEGVEDYIGPIAKAGKLTEPGVVASYNNVGWIVAEVILRRLTGRNCHELLRERVIEPLGLERTVLSAREAILHRTAIGAFPTAGGDHEATPQFMYPDAWAAPGTTLITTVEDTVRFLRMHLNDGMSVDGRRVISAQSAVVMRTPTVQSATGPHTGFGLGWRYHETDGHYLYSHAGGSPGGVAQAVISPADNVAAIAFVNSNRAMPLHHALIELLLPERPSPVAPPHGEIRRDVDLRPFTGSYRRRTERADISIEGENLRVRLIPLPEDLPGATFLLRDGVTEFSAAPINETTLVSLGAGPLGSAVPLSFSEPEDSGYQLMCRSARLARRTADSAPAR